MHFPIEKSIVDDRDLLMKFIKAYEQHIFVVLGFKSLENYSLPTITTELKEVLGEVGRQEIADDFFGLRQAVEGANHDALSKHGLIGPQLRFKISYLNSIEERLYQGGRFEFNRLFGKSLGGIADTIIDSVIDATGAGVGIKEIGGVASDVIGDAIDDD